MPLFVTNKVLGLDLQCHYSLPKYLWFYFYSIKKVLDVHAAFQVLWVLELLLANIKTFAFDLSTSDNISTQPWIDQFHKFRNAPVPYPTILHSEQKCAHFCSEWSIVGYGTGAFWDLWIWSIPAYGTHHRMYNVSGNKTRITWTPFY